MLNINPLTVQSQLPFIFQAEMSNLRIHCVSLSYSTCFVYFQDVFKKQSDDIILDSRVVTGIPNYLLMSYRGVLSVVS